MNAIGMTELKPKLIETLSDSQDGNPVKKFFTEKGMVKDEHRDQVYRADPLSAFLARAITDAYADSLDVEQAMDNLRDRLRYGVDQLTRAQDALKEVQRWMEDDDADAAVHRAEMKKIIGY